MSYAAEVLADAPWGWWRFTDPISARAAGTIADTGSIGGTYTRDPGAQTGLPAVMPDGGGSAAGAGETYIAQRALPAALAGTAVSAEAWVALPAGNMAGAFVHLGSSNGWAFGIGGTTMDNTGRTLILLDEAVSWRATSYSFPAGAGVYHVAVTRNGNAFLAYVNGVQVYSGTHAPATPTGSATIGAVVAGTTRPIPGNIRIDNVAFFASTLSAARVAAHYASGSGSASEVAADAPTSWVRFDDTAVDISADDSSANGNRLVLLGAAPTLVATAPNGGGYDFGSSASLLRASAPIAQPTVVTHEAWVKIAANPAATTVLVTGGTDSGSFGTTCNLSIGTDGKPFLDSYNGSGASITAPSALSLNAWHHVVGSVGPAGMKLYVDGALVATNAGRTSNQSFVSARPAVHAVNATPISAGSTSPMALVDAALYLTQLSDARVLAHYTAGAAPAAVVPEKAGTSTTTGLAAAAAVAIAITAGALTSTGTATGGASAVLTATGSASSTGQSSAAVTGAATPVRDALATSTGTATASASVVPVVAVTGSASSTGLVEVLVEVGGPMAYATTTGTATAAVELTPGTSVGFERGRVRVGTGVATWEPPVVEPPATVAPVHARIAAHAYEAVTMVGTRPRFTGHVTVEKARQRDRILVGGRDVTYWRGAVTPLPRFGLVSPLLWGAGTLEVPQVAACFESPGDGALAWLREGATVVVQRVWVDGPNAGKVAATDYRGIITGFDTSGRSLTVELGGDALGRAALRDKQPPIFKRRNDLGWWWWSALAGPDGLYRPFGKVGGPTTGIRLYDTGGSRYLEHLNELAAKGTNLTGAQWTCTPIESGPAAGTYRVHRKDVETIHATVYLDDAHTVGALQADAGERPNRIYGTGVTPRGERARFGVYPVLAERQRARFPNYLDDRAIEQGDTNADTDTNGGVTALLRRLSVTGYLSTDDFAGGFDADAARAVRDLQEDAGLAETGRVNVATWAALFDVDVVGYSTRGSRVEPIAQANSVKRVRRNASGQVIGPNPGHDPRRLVVDRTIDFGTGITRGQMRNWARADLGSATPGSTPSGNGRHWTGTIRFQLGAVIAGQHTPGDPVLPGNLMHARALRPGMNLWLPLFDGGTQLHVAGVDVDSAETVTVSVDTRARDTMTVAEVIARNQDNKRNPARAWIRDHRSSSFVKDAVTEFDEIGGTITDKDLDAGWNVFPVVAGQEGTIARLRLRLDKPAEFVTAVFGRRISPRRLAGVIGNPLEHAGAKRWSDEARRDKLVGDHVLLYVAGDDQAPCGYYPGTKEVRTYTPQVPNPDYNLGVPVDHELYDNRETLNEQVPNPAYDPTDPENDQEFIDKVVTEQLTEVTGRWDDDASFGYRTFDSSCVLWVAVYVRRARTLEGGRIMWPQLEAGS